MKLTLYQIDAFANKLFAGNPAAVIPLENWIDDSLMQDIAMENNLAETVFFVPLPAKGTGSKDGADFHIRWFTPGAEINLCGHATLASAYVLFEILGFDKKEIVFHSLSGPLRVRKEVAEGGFMGIMDFPSWKPEKINDYPPRLEEALGVKEIVGVYKSRDLLVELNTEDDVKNAQPDFTLIKKTGQKIIITAPGRKHPGAAPAADFVSRFFAPTLGIDEDPVTGSAHSQLIPFWSDKLSVTSMRARQLSRRGGELLVKQVGDRVEMGGGCVFYMKAEISVG
ncbi:MAG: PhzF family phenazine biosynthesis protein [Chitinophagaceae bacterium]|nr:PhzF family phenazine biosynthesis protein [Chitinophagaceae bacterium]